MVVKGNVPERHEKGHRAPYGGLSGVYLKTGMFPHYFVALTKYTGHLF